MKELSVHVAGSPRPVYVPERPEDLAEAGRMLREYEGPLGLDTETTGLGVHGPSFRVRTVQLGGPSFAVVLPVEAGLGRELARDLLARRPVVAIHNAAYDIHALAVSGLVQDRDDLWRRTVDTKLLAHLVDPRAKEEGGTGLGLKDLCAAYFDPSAKDPAAELKSAFRALGLKSTDGSGWAGIPLNHEDYLRYAGADAIQVVWLLEALRPLIVGRSLTELSRYEHELARICAGMSWRGMLVDANYLGQLGPALDAEAEEAEAVAARLGVAKVGSPRQVASALEALGATFTERTGTGAWKVDREVLLSLADRPGEVGVLASAVHRAKAARKLRSTYVDGVLAELDVAGRVHPSINTLQARTARMSITGPALQTLPSGDWRIRRAFIADPGHLIGSADLDGVELRVLAALSKDANMLAAFREGADLHQRTADAAGVSRKVGKMANFLTVYGGGAGKLSRSASIDMATAKGVLDAYARTYPGVKRLSRRLVSRTDLGVRDVVTPTGRRIPVDRNRAYAALNYLVQSTARDVLGQGLINMDAAGLSRYLLLPVHDEVVFQAPASEAEEVARAVGETLTISDFLGSGIDLTSTGEVFGPSWGHGYGFKEITLDE